MYITKCSLKNMLFNTCTLYFTDQKLHGEVSHMHDFCQNELENIDGDLQFICRIYMYSHKCFDRNAKMANAKWDTVKGWDYTLHFK